MRFYFGKTTRFWAVKIVIGRIIMSEECRVLTKEQYDEMFRRINELEQKLSGAEQSVQEGLEINEELKADNKQLYDKCKLEHSIVKDLQKENKELVKKCNLLEEKLSIAVKALEDYADEDEWMYSHERTGCVSERCNEYNEDCGYTIAQEALKQIKEIK